MREDISAEREEDDWLRVTCDAPGCENAVDMRMGGKSAAGWVVDARATPMATNTVRDYCPTHAERADA